MLRRHWPWIVWLAGPLCYLTGLAAASVVQSVGWQEVVWFDGAWFDPPAFETAWFEAFEAFGTLPPEGGESAPTAVAPPGESSNSFGAGLAVSGLLMALGAGWLLIGAPWLLGTWAIEGRPGRSRHAAAWSLASNCLAIMGLITLLRLTTGVSRPVVLLVWLSWSGLLAWLVWRKWPAPSLSAGRSATAAEHSARSHGGAVLVALAGVAAAMVCFAPEWLVQCHSGDGTEASVLARSLKEHLLPYFEVESLGKPGFVVGSPTLVNSYWTCAFQILLGSSEATARLPFWIWSAAIMVVAVSMLPRRSVLLHYLGAVVCGLMGLLWCLWYSFYTGYYPYLADPAAPGVPDALYTLLLLLALDALRRGDLGAWVLSMVLSSVVLYAGPVMFGLISVAAIVWQPLPRRDMFWAIGRGIAALAGVLGFYIVCGLVDGAFWGWPRTIYSEYVADFVMPASRWSTGWRYAACYVLGCGGLGCAGLAGAFLLRGHDSRRSETDRPRSAAVFSPRARGPERNRATRGADEGAWQRSVATLVLAYLLIVLLSGSKNLHYLGPIVPPAVVLWLRQSGFWRSPHRAEVGLAATAAGMVAAIALCWPAMRPIFTLNRQLGAQTVFRTRSVWEAYRWARLSESLYDQGLLSWQVGPHTWVDYARLDIEPLAPRPLLVTGREPPPGYRLLFRSPDGIAFCATRAELGKLLQRPRPPRARERFPWILRRLLLDVR